MDAVEYLDLLLKALLLAGVYSAMAVGMTVIYGVMKIVNLAHAGFLMLGAYFAMELFQRFHIDPILGAVLALPLAAVHLGVDPSRAARTGPPSRTSDSPGRSTPRVSTWAARSGCTPTC